MERRGKGQQAGKEGKDDRAGGGRENPGTDHKQEEWILLLSTVLHFVCLGKFNLKGEERDSEREGKGRTIEQEKGESREGS